MAFCPSTTSEIFSGKPTVKKDAAGGVDAVTSFIPAPYQEKRVGILRCCYEASGGIPIPEVPLS
jgi:hypothetical protein